MNSIALSCIYIKYCLRDINGCGSFRISMEQIEAIEASFVEFGNKVEDKSKLFCRPRLPLEGEWFVQ